MATTIRTPIGAVAIDNLRFDDSSPGLDIFNKIPEDGETRVKVGTTIDFWVSAYAGALLPNTIRVWLSIPATEGSRVLVYDGNAGGFQGSYTGVATLQQSPGASSIDELIFSLIPPATLLGETLYKVEVHAQASSQLLNAAYTFTTEATEPPCVDELLWLDPRRVRARWRETMQADDRVQGTRYFKNLTGAVEFVAPDKLTVVNLTPSSEWIGYWLGCSGSAYPQNNGYFQVTGIDTVLRQVAVDTRGATFKNDDGEDRDADGNLVRKRTLRATLSSYRIEPRPQDELPDIVCAYAPIITGVLEPTDDQLPVGADETRYVILELHDDISIGRKYKMHCVRALNESGNPATLLSDFDFISPRFGSPTNRIDLWNLFPATDRDEDLLAEGQLRRMACVLQDALNVLWHRCDTLETLTDPDSCPVEWVDYLLYTMGNPFRFPLTELEKRRLIAVLVGIYKRVGTKQVIEDSLAFFLGITFSVRPFLTADFWTLGVDVLGVTAILGPGDAYARNAYEIVSPVALTAEQRRQVTEIAEFLDPVYMHLVRIVEPGETPGTLVFWVMGESALGVTTQLAPVPP